MMERAQFEVPVVADHYILDNVPASKFTAASAAMCILLEIYDPLPKKSEYEIAPTIPAICDRAAIIESCVIETLMKSFRFKRNLE